MASFLRCTLIADGTSDRCLLRVLDWCLRSQIGQREVLFDFGFAHFGALSNVHGTIDGRITSGTHDFPCDLLFIHRDAERQSRTDRLDEITTAIRKTRVSCPVVPVIPIRMTEAWLLISEPAIRTAAGNPNGGAELSIPRLEDLESIPDPKEVLKSLLLQASEKRGRRKIQFERDLAKRMHQVAEYVVDYSPLRRLTAFRALEEDLTNALGSLPAFRR